MSSSNTSRTHARTHYARLLVVAVGATLSSAAGAGETTLIAHYQFENDVLDSSPSRLHGVLEDTPESPSNPYTAGPRGSALRLASGSYVTVPDADAMDLGDSDFTIAFWASLDMHEGQQVLLEKCGGDCGSAAWTITAIHQSGIDTQLHFNGGNSPQAPVVQFIPGTFYHIAWTRSGNSWTVFVNGVQIHSWTEDADLSALGAQLYIGRRNPAGGNAYALNGAVDDVRIYHNALNQTDIQLLASTCPTDTNNDGTVDVDDLIRVILDWDADGSGNGGDVNGDGTVNVDDLVQVILNWGDCAV